jgi:hypothetical protein
LNIDKQHAANSADTSATAGNADATLVNTQHSNADSLHPLMLYKEQQRRRERVRCQAPHMPVYTASVTSQKATGTLHAAQCCAGMLARPCKCNLNSAGLKNGWHIIKAAHACFVLQTDTGQSF